MSGQFVGSPVTGTGSATSQQYTRTGVAAGNALLLIVMDVGASAPNNITSVFDAQDSYQKIGESPGDGYLSAWLLESADAGDHTVTITCSVAPYATVMFLEVSGASVLSGVTTSAQAAASYTNAADQISAGAITPSVDNCMVIGATCPWGGSGYTHTAGTGYTKYAEYSGAWAGNLAVESLLQTTAQAVGGTWTSGDGNTPGRSSIVFALAPSGPTITTQPDSAASVVGGSAIFTAAATGSTSVKVQQNTGSGWTDIAGATSTTYTKTGLALTDSGLQIRFAFSDGTTTVYSNAATLQVGAASARLYPVLGGNPIGSFGWLGRAGASSPIRTAGCGAVSVHASDARMRAYAG